MPIAIDTASLLSPSMRAPLAFTSPSPGPPASVYWAGRLAEPSSLPSPEYFALFELKIQAQEHSSSLLRTASLAHTGPPARIQVPPCRPTVDPSDPSSPRRSMTSPQVDLIGQRPYKLSQRHALTVQRLPPPFGWRRAHVRALSSLASRLPRKGPVAAVRFRGATFSDPSRENCHNQQTRPG